VHLARRLVNRSLPRFIDIAVTYRCQCRCVHCSADAYPRAGRQELTTAGFKSLIDQARDLGVLEVIFSGGEPLLRHDIVQLIRHAHQRGLLIRLNTNGLLLDRQRVAELKKAGLTQCAVSIDDADPAVHDALRGLSGSHAKAIEGIRNLREVGIPCQILTYASRRNVTGGLERIRDLARELGVLAVFIFFPMAVGRWADAFGEVLTAQERARVRALQDLTLVHLELPTPRTVCCAQDRLVLYATAQGDITPCPFVPFVIGNVKQRPLRELWHRYCADLRLAYRGDCPMNDVGARDAFREYVESVAASLR